MPQKKHIDALAFDHSHKRLINKPTADDPHNKRTHPTTADSRFIPQRANAKPSNLFFNVTKEDSTGHARFNRIKDPQEYLIFISGCCTSETHVTDRAVYAFAWGPGPNHKVYNLEHNDKPQTANRAQLRAAVEALRSLMSRWADPRLLENAHNTSRVLVAFSGNYFLNHVALRSDLREDVGNGTDNEDLKLDLADALDEIEFQGVRVLFWQVKPADNRAETLASTRLFGKEFPVQTALRMIIH